MCALEIVCAFGVKEARGVCVRGRERACVWDVMGAKAVCASEGERECG